MSNVKKKFNILKKNLRILKERRIVRLIKITKEESLKLRERYPNVVIAIVNKQSSHKKYWAEETIKVRKFLNKIRNEK